MLTLTINRPWLPEPRVVSSDANAIKARQRRERRKNAGTCINGTLLVTDGVRCDRCKLVHKHGIAKARLMLDYRDAAVCNPRWIPPGDHMPHYRTMMKNAEYLNSADLFDEKNDVFREAVVQIDRVTKGEIAGEKGRKDGMPFVYFKGKGKPLGANATNCKSIARIAGSPKTERWIGLWITLYVTKTDSRDGEVDCIRIRPKAAKPGEQGGDAFDSNDVQAEDRQ